jgi:molybdopterin converting factor small subunit
MTVRLLAFGIAKDIIGGSTLELNLEDKVDIATIKEVLLERFPEFRKLKSLAFAVNTAYQSDDYVLQENDEVVLIPPVSGG